MRFGVDLLSFMAILAVVTLIQACRFQHLRPRRRDRELKRLRGRLTGCLQNKFELFGECWPIKSFVDFTTFDSRWFEASERQHCAVDKGLSTADCWKSSLRHFLRPNSTFLSASEECIDDYQNNIKPRKRPPFQCNDVPVTCFNRNKTISSEYNACFNQPYGERSHPPINVKLLITFAEKHLFCNASVPGSCSQKDVAICPAAKWPRLLENIMKPGYNYRMRIINCNARLFPRPFGSTCIKWLPAFGMRNHTVTSPGYSTQGHNNLDCTYHFEAQYTLGLVLTVEVDTESCCDFVTISFKNNTVLERISGKVTRRFVVDSNIRNLYLHYNTDESILSKGFRATYSNVCAYSFNTSTFPTIVAPSYNEALQIYGEEMDCKWEIVATSGESMFLEIERIRTLPCCDTLEIFDGNFSLGNYAVAKASYVPIKSTSGRLLIHYHTNCTSRRSGFKAEYSKAYECGELLAANASLQHFVMTPQTRIWGLGNVRCYWHFTSSPGFVVLLNTSLPLGQQHKYHGWIKVFDGPFHIDDNFDGIHCYASSQNRIGLYYYSNVLEASGFNASYRQAACNASYHLTNSATKQISSPDYHGFVKNKFQKCTYTLHAQPGKRIKASLEMYTRKGYLEVITDGNVNLGRITRGKKTFQLTSSGETLTFSYFARFSRLAETQGFIAKYKQFIPECGWTKATNESWQFVFSPDYPNYHENKITCDWIITAPTNKQIMLKIIDIIIKKKQGALYVYDQMMTLGKYSTSSSADITLISSTNVLRIKFRCRGGGQSQNRFNAMYKQVINSGWNKLISSDEVYTLANISSPTQTAQELKYFWNFRARDITRHLTMSLTWGKPKNFNNFLQVMDDTKILGKIYGDFNFPLKFTSCSPFFRIYFCANRVSLNDSFSMQLQQI